MQSDTHQRARSLVDQGAVEGISPEEQRWLSRHTDECGECAGYAEMSQRAIRALDSFAFEIDPEAARRVQDAVRDRLIETRPRRRNLMAGIVAAMVLTVAGSLVMWALTGWMAERWGIPARAWQMGFAMFWVLPSILLDAVLVFGQRFIGEHLAVEEGESL